MKANTATTYWMLTETEECPDCGKSRTTKSRQHTPKPANPAERFRYDYMRGCPCIY